MNLLNEKLLPSVKAKEIVKGIGKPDDMKYEQKNAYDHLKVFADVDPKKIEALVEELGKDKKLRKRQVVMIANMLPDDREDLRVILQKEYSNFTPEEIKLILDNVKKVKS